MVPSGTSRVHFLSPVLNANVYREQNLSKGEPDRWHFTVLGAARTTVESSLPVSAFTASPTGARAATLAGLAQNLCTRGVCWAQSHFIAVFRAELCLAVGCLEVLSEHCALLCESILTLVCWFVFWFYFFNLFSCLLFQEPGLYCCGNADRETALGRVRSHGSHLQNRHPTDQPPAPLSHIRTLPGLSKADLCGSQAQTLCWRAAQTSVCTAPVLNYLPC